MVQRHSVVISTKDGGVEVYPLKQRLRQNPERLPRGLDPTSSTSHQMRSGLRQMGWTMQETPTEVLMIAPGDHQSATLAEEVLGSAEDTEESAAPYFSLKYQLRDFIASNLNTIDLNGRRLRLYVNSEGRDGIEYPSAVGRSTFSLLTQKARFSYSSLNGPKVLIEPSAKSLGMWAGLGRQSEKRTRSTA